ncbi:hypothetical protein VZT92_003613 [Zoarces viviparus]|uniref:Uncharacterized protein n=1 Tax=Zoarces viviparus TaxID=48416 RepID=A0AAW1FUQ0_ZOAVI
MKALDRIFLRWEGIRKLGFPGETCHAASERDYIAGAALPLMNQQVFGRRNTLQRSGLSEIWPKSRPSHPPLSSPADCRRVRVG